MINPAGKGKTVPTPRSDDTPTELTGTLLPATSLPDYFTYRQDCRKGLEAIVSREAGRRVAGESFVQSMHNDRFLQVSEVAAAVVGAYIGPVFGLDGHFFPQAEGLAAAIALIGAGPAAWLALKRGRTGAVQAVKDQSVQIDEACRKLTERRLAEPKSSISPES